MTGSPNETARNLAGTEEKKAERSQKRTPCTDWIMLANSIKPVSTVTQPAAIHPQTVAAAKDFAEISTMKMKKSSIATISG